ncbi:hypothetical protein AVEN_43595-1 [Araneus ventricosus]|uniref:Reverse transcriptase/retrotransposon-derived protein RNase H-like domain-containing protein n=1 Tax=Araneus ventricosus TaxID=182803 RepID=A0A4Y2ELS8_ARAVE|nr:hypothetical protein AVEN_43595-1 [Araneus ventricosus]
MFAFSGLRKPRKGQKEQTGSRGLHGMFGEGTFRFSPPEVVSELRLTTSVIFLGHTLSSEGTAVDKLKSEAIPCMSKPEDRQSLHRYLGMINYLSRLLKNLSTLIAPLREKIKNNTVWVWNPTYDKILDPVKVQIIKSTVFAFFDPKVESEIVVDASPFGLGAVLQQKVKRIALTTSTLTPT